jgi:hypothetical protein
MASDQGEGGEEDVEHHAEPTLARG